MLPIISIVRTSGGCVFKKPVKKYSPLDFWEKASYEKIDKLRTEANQNYYSKNQISSLDMGHQFMAVAELAHDCTMRTTDIEARKFFLQDIVLPLYSNAQADFGRALRVEGLYTNKEVFNLWLNAELIVADLHIKADMHERYESDVGDMKGIYLEAKKWYGTEQAGLIIVEHLKNTRIDNLNKKISLLVYDVLIKYLDPEFYQANPHANILGLFRRIMEESMCVAAELNTADFEARRIKMTAMIEHYDKFKDDYAVYNNISLAGKPETKHPTLRKRNRYI